MAAINAVFTIRYVANLFGEDEDWLFDLAGDVFPEDGCLWVYVARQNNVLFSLLAQFFGPEAINSRLLLIETISFTTTAGDMLDSPTRIVGDRAVGGLFFENARLMDYKLMGGDAREPIISEDAKHGIKPLLPPQMPFGDQWPTLVTVGPGPASLADLH